MGKWRGRLIQRIYIWSVGNALIGDYRPLFEEEKGKGGGIDFGFGIVYMGM